MKKRGKFSIIKFDQFHRTEWNDNLLKENK